MKKTLLSAFIITLLFTNCKYGSVSLKYPTNPEAYLPEGVHTLALVNRSLTEKDVKKTSVAEAVVSGEIAGSDRKASDECLKGVFDRMNGRKNMNIVIPATTRLYGTGTRVTPELLDWTLVKKICDSTKADALLVLENFDSNSDLLLSALTGQVNNVLSGNIGGGGPPNQVRMNVYSYWRLYDPINKKVIDQYQVNTNLTFNTAGLSIPPPDALPKTAYAAGEEYIERFLPGYYSVKRDMYKKGKGAEKGKFATAFRKSELADWEGASVIWTELSRSSSTKNAGRACLNMAVACEVLGKNELALMWAKKSYEEYSNKIGRDYANQLQYRLKVE